MFRSIVTCFMSVSVKPPLVAVCLDSAVAGLPQPPLINNFSMSVLRENQGSLAKLWSGKDSNLTGDLPWIRSRAGVPMLENSLATLVCRVSQAVDVGDHKMLIGEVEELMLHGGAPLVAWRGGFYKLELDTPHLAGSAALEKFVRDWEVGALPRSLWNHVAHITIISYYTFDRDVEAAYQLMKAGVINYNRCVGILDTQDSGYHETLTRFWTEVVSSFVRNGQFSSRLEAVRKTVEMFGSDREHYRLYYSYDVKKDRRARREMVAPDRRPLNLNPQ